MGWIVASRISGRPHPTPTPNRAAASLGVRGPPHTGRDARPADRLTRDLPRRQPRAARAAPRRVVHAHLHRPAVQHRARAAAADARDARRRRRRPHRLRRPPLPHRAARRRRSYDDRHDDYLAFIEPRLREARRLLARRRNALLPPRLPRGPLLQGAARRALRPRLLPQRDHLGLRLRRARRSGAGPRSTTRSSSTSRTRRPTTSTPRPSTASRTWRRASSAPEKAARGKLPTDVWWHTIVSPTGTEKTGYPTQKPLGVLRRIVQASSREGDWCLDFFAGSGTLGRRRARARPPLRPLRLEPRGGRGHARAPRPRGLHDAGEPLPERRAVSPPSTADQGGAAASLRRGPAAPRDVPPPSRGEPLAMAGSARGYESLRWRGFSVSDLISSRGGRELGALGIDDQPAVRCASSRRSASTAPGMRGEGAYLWDSKGERYLDLHRRLRDVQRRAQQPARARRADRGARARPSRLGPARGLAAAAAARRGAPASGRRRASQRVLFTSSGTEAVEAALKLGRAATGRSAGALRRPRLPRAHARLALGERQPRVQRPLRPAAARLRRASRSAISTRSRRSSAARTSPSSSSSRCRGRASTCRPTGYLEAAQALCRRYGTLFCVDEVQTGLRAHGQVVCLRALGSRARSRARSRSRSRGATSRSARC